MNKINHKERTRLYKLTSQNLMEILTIEISPEGYVLGLVIEIGEVFPKDFCFPFLEKLEISGQETIMPMLNIQILRKHEMLKNKSINFFNLSEIPDFTGLIHLNKLELRSCCIASLSGFEKLINLKHLDLSYNLISNMNKLKRLYP